MLGHKMIEEQVKSPFCKTTPAWGRGQIKKEIQNNLYGKDFEEMDIIGKPLEKDIRNRVIRKHGEDRQSPCVDDAYLFLLKQILERQDEFLHPPVYMTYKYIRIVIFLKYPISVKKAGYLFKYSTEIIEVQEGIDSDADNENE